MKPLSEYSRARIHRLHELLETIDPAVLNRIGEEILRAYREDATIYLIGNGGSASTASHMSCDLSKSTISSQHRRLRALSLTDNMPWFSAIANDADYSQVFVEQLRSILRPKDVVLALSASGNSPNILEAVRFASQAGASTIAFVGFDGGKLRELVDLALFLPGGDYGTQEDAHLILNHAMVEFMTDAIAGGGTE